MAPYRTVSQDEHAEAPRDAGIVGDVIGQFADPLAFYRELVQNAIDAESPNVDGRDRAHCITVLNIALASITDATEARAIGKLLG